MITRHPVKKAIGAWLMLAMVLVIPGLYLLQWATPLLDIMRAYTGGAMASEVTLEENWVIPFDEDRQFPYSFVTRGERLIMTSETTARAIHIRSGEVIWTNDQLKGSTIQISSTAESVPLLILQFTGGQYSQLLNVDSESGKIIWKRRLKTDAPAINFDAGTVIIYDMNRIWVYATDNQLLLEKSFPDKWGIDVAVINREILIACQSENSRKLLYFSRESGDILWEDLEPEYEPGHKLGQGYQFMYTQEGKSNVMYLPEQRLEWKSSQNVGYAVGTAAQPGSHVTLPAEVLFTTTSAVNSKNGKRLYTYPQGSRFGCLTNSYLILLEGHGADTSKASSAGLLILDQVSGIIKKIIPGKRIFNIMKIAENDSHIYLMANHFPDRKNSFKTVSDLLILDKNSVELQEISVGSNIIMHQIKIFPGENMIFIPTHQFVGTYKITTISER